MCDDRDHEARIASLEVNVFGPRDSNGNVTAPGLAQRTRLIEEYFDTADSPVWKRWLFRLDGWGPWYRLRTRPHWRPWRRWWTS